MLKMKILYILLFFILSFSCKQEADNGIKIDLTQKKTKIRYSEFVDSVSYLTLYSNDSCIVSQIRQLYETVVTLSFRIETETVYVSFRTINYSATLPIMDADHKNSSLSLAFAWIKVINTSVYMITRAEN